MTRILRFKVHIKGLEEKIYRVIEVNEENTLADLAYVILASFNSLAYHLYQIRHNDTIYDSMIMYDEKFNKQTVNATTTKLSDMILKKNDDISMEYDFGTPTVFCIKYLGYKAMKKGYSRVYPHIFDGKGNGMLDDILGEDLIKIVQKTDELGKSSYSYPSGYHKSEKYDYRNYNTYDDNVKLKPRIMLIKYGYEMNKK